MSEKQKTILEKLAPDLEYVRNGDYYVPTIIDSTPEGKKLNHWGHQYADYFKTILKGGPYDYALMEGVLNARCYEVGERADAMYQSLYQKMAKEYHLDDIQKTDYRKAVKLIEEIQSKATEIVMQEVIYDDDCDWLPEE